MPRSLATTFGFFEDCCVVARHTLIKGLIRPRMADRVIEKDEALEVDFLDPQAGRDADESRQFGQGFLESGQPGRNARIGVALAVLKGAERADVAQDAVEIVLAANRQIGGTRRGVERDPQFVEAGADQRSPVLVVQQRAVGVKQDVGAAVLEIAHHPGKVLHQHGLADAMQHRTLGLRNLIHDAGEQIPAHVGRRLQVGVGARAGRAKQVAAVRGLKIQADRRTLGSRRYDGRRGLVIPAGVKGRPVDDGTHAHAISLDPADRIRGSPRRITVIALDS